MTLLESDEVSPLEEIEDDFPRPARLNKDEFLVAFVDADNVEDNDREVGRFIGTGWKVIEGDLESALSVERASNADEDGSCCGRGWSGGSGGIGKCNTGPNTTCLKYVVK